MFECKSRLLVLVYALLASIGQPGPVGSPVDRAEQQQANREDDDAQVIFETLNGRGAELHATDLIRNFIFPLVIPRRERATATARRLTTAMARSPVVRCARFYL